MTTVTTIASAYPRKTYSFRYLGHAYLNSKYTTPTFFSFVLISTFILPFLSLGLFEEFQRSFLEIGEW